MNGSDMVANTAAIKIDHKNIFYPPGGILLWIVILVELLTFGIALIIMGYLNNEEREVFHQSAGKLNTIFGSVNTILLLASGYCMAMSVNFFKVRKIAKSRRLLIFTLLLGLLFIIIKSVEYSFKIQEGYTLGSNTFFDFYWLLTGFHLIHVIVGMVILIWLSITQHKRSFENALNDYEAGAAFWHLCDLIWLILFPVLYMVF
jgi:nitric oxide reductase NorE protein